MLEICSFYNYCSTSDLSFSAQSIKINLKNPPPPISSLQFVSSATVLQSHLGDQSTGLLLLQCIICISFMTLLTSSELKIHRFSNLLLSSPALPLCLFLELSGRCLRKLLSSSCTLHLKSGTAGDRHTAEQCVPTVSS